MYRHILIGTDGSELANRGLHHGLQLAKNVGARVTILTVTEMWSALDMAQAARSEPFRQPIEQYERVASETATHILDAAAAVAKAADVPFSTLHKKDMDPADGILEAADGQGCDLIVLASHGRRGMGRLALGSRTAEVLTRTKVPVLVVR